MCNLAEALVEKTRRKTIKETREKDRKYYANKLAKSVKDKILSVSQAADILDMTEKEFEVFLK